MLQFGQITALGTVVFTSVLLIRNASAVYRLSTPTYSALPGAANSKKQSTSAIATQLLAWATGVFAVYVLDWVGFRSAFSLGTGTGAKDIVTLATMQKVVIGLMAASTLSTVNEVKKALDNTDSARAPALMGSPILPAKPAG
jgi:hypothetical protein